MGDAPCFFKYEKNYFTFKLLFIYAVKMKRMGALATLVKRDVVPTAVVAKGAAEPSLELAIVRVLMGNMFSGLRPSFNVIAMPEGHQIRSPG
jgi:hypothetical protein